MIAAPEILAVAEAYQLPGLPSTPRDMPLAPHHARSGSELGAMMIDEQQPYFGWNESHSRPSPSQVQYGIRLWAQGYAANVVGTSPGHVPRTADSAFS